MSRSRSSLSEVNKTHGGRSRQMIPAGTDRRDPRGDAFQSRLSEQTRAGHAELTADIRRLVDTGRPMDIGGSPRCSSASASRRPRSRQCQACLPANEKNRRSRTGHRPSRNPSAGSIAIIFSAVAIRPKPSWPTATTSAASSMAQPSIERFISHLSDDRITNAMIDAHATGRHGASSCFDTGVPISSCTAIMEQNDINRPVANRTDMTPSMR